MKINKKFLLIITVCLGLLAGCQSVPTEGANGEQNNVSKKTEFADITSYEYDSNSKFKVVHCEEIDDGTVNGTRISILVHKDTKVMYMQTIKFQAGYGLSSEVMLDPDGKPLLYDGEI